MTAAPRLFCFGLGYTGRAVAVAAARQGWRIAGTRRAGPAGAEEFDPGWTVESFDRDHPLADPAAALAGTTHLLSTVPPDAGGDPVLDCHAADIAKIEGLRWVGYLSTTGVYGDHGGGWVDEGTAPTPGGERARRRVAAEDGWLRLHRDHGAVVHLFRLAGIYGPGRSALDSVRAGTARRIVKPGQVFSRIHLDDIVAVVGASMTQPQPGAVYNLCDDRPAPPEDVIAFAAALLGVPPPPEIPIAEAELSEMARSFYADNKRVRNDRIKTELGIRLRYPDYETGLRAIFAAHPESR